MDYDSWKLGLYNDEVDHDLMCKHCEENEQRMDECKEFLDELVKQLYSKEELNPVDVEHCLDSLCYLLGVKVNKGDMQIQRRQEDNVASWINNKYKELKAKI